MPTHELVAALDSDCSIIIISCNLKKLSVQLLPVHMKLTIHYKNVKICTMYHESGWLKFIMKATYEVPKNSKM